MKQGERTVVIQKNKMIWPVLLVGASLLVGCHKNPLTEGKHAVTLPGLVEASRLAEIKLGVKDADGWAYYYCMDEKKKSEVNCEDLFHAMVGFAQKNTALRGLNKADITNKRVFEGIVDDYFEQVMDRTD